MAHYLTYTKTPDALAKALAPAGAVRYIRQDLAEPGSHLVEVTGDERALFAPLAEAVAAGLIPHYLPMGDPFVDKPCEHTEAEKTDRELFHLPKDFWVVVDDTAHHLVDLVKQPWCELRRRYGGVVEYEVWQMRERALESLERRIAAHTARLRAAGAEDSY
jgi:hypothetical protein